MDNGAGAARDDSKRETEERAKECGPDCSNRPTDRSRLNVAMATLVNAIHPRVDDLARRIIGAQMAENS